MLSELKEKTDKIFENNKLNLPEFSISAKDRMEALEKCGLKNHKTSCIFDARCEQAERLGFQSYNSSEFVEMLMGEKHDETETVYDRQNHEWAYDHHKNEISTSWGSKPTDFIKYEYETINYLFSSKKIKKQKWRCRFGKLDYLKVAIPYGVILRINELKEAKIFNAFSVFAPIEAWERKTDIDPIVVGSMWEIVEIKKNNTSSYESGQAKHYFIAQW